MKRIKGIDYTSELETYYINQLLDSLEAEMAEGGHKKLLDKLIDIRRELDNYYDVAVEHAEMLNEIRWCLDE